MASVESPTALEFTPDGRLLVASQFGELRIVQNGTLVPQPAFDLNSVLCTANEQGLLGVAVDPAFATTGFVYVYYTRSKSGSCVNRVSRFTMSGSTISTATEAVLVDEIPAPSGNHNGGDLEFGKDGYLYVSVGDGACDYAGGGCYGQNDAARDQHVLLGKILRITGTGEIPPTNPFQGAGTARCNVTGRTTAGTKCQETYGWGLRNPFRMAFDPNAAATRFFVNDVGDGAWEEVNEGIAGADYGWNVREGPCANGSFTNCGPPPAGMTNPLYAYSHAESPCHAITGGAFVPNGFWPAEHDGTYLYGDYTCGKIFQLRPNGSGGYARTEFAGNVGAVVNMTFGPSPFGRGLYYTNYDGGGQVRRIDYVATENRQPTARMTADPTYGALPLTVAFDGSASSDPDAGDTLTYTWNFGDGTPPATTTAATTTHRYTTSGPFTASLTVVDRDGAASAPATVRLDPGNTAPAVTIDTPTESDRFAVGESISLSATATDAEDGALGPGNLSWRVLRHHDAHTHPFLAPTAGNDIVVTQPAPEDLRSGIEGYLEIQLTATDSRGVSTTVTRNVYPQKVDLTFATDPSGRDVIVADTTFAAPATVTSWEGHAFGVEARSQTDGAGKLWTFQSWSDGGAAAHTIVTPATATTYTATFAESAAPAGLVAAYGFNEGSGTAAADASGRGNVGVVSGAAWIASGRFGSALSFDGTNDWVTVADSASLDLAAGMTVSAWVRPSALGGWRTVVFKERSGGVVYSLYADDGGSRPVGQVYIGGERNAAGTAPVPSGTWTYLATTFDGSVLRLYVNGSLVSSTPISGAMQSSSEPLRIGGNGVWPEWFDGLIDEVRVYERALAASEIQRDMAAPVAAPGDSSPPTAPSGLAASAGVGFVSLSWSPSSDDLGVARYDVHRSTAAGFSPSAANRVGQPAGTSFFDSGLAAGTYYYRIAAEDAAGNVGAYTPELAVVVPPDRPPTVSLTAPANGATVSGVVSVTAAASDDVAVAGVRFRVGGVEFGAEDTTAPYAVSWDTRSVANGTYVLTAAARDSAAQTSTSDPVSVTVDNPPTPPPPTSGLVAAFGFEEGSGTSVADRSGRGNSGVISGASWTAAGRHGSALSFDGTNDWVTVADGASLDLSSAMTVSAWVRPAALGGWRTVIFKERPGGVVYSLFADQAGSRPAGQVYLGGERNAIGTAAVPLNTWTHLASTYDGATVRLFVNGLLAGSTAVTGAMQPSSGPLRIGGNSIWAEWFAGVIDEVRVYERALTATEIEIDMQAPIDDPAPTPTPPPPSVGLVAAFGFEEGTGTSVADRSGRGNAGVVSGASWTAAGRHGSALSFDGTNDWVTVVDSDSLDLSAALTVSAWVRPSALGGWRTVIFKERPGGMLYSLYADNAGSRPTGQVDLGGEQNAVGSAPVAANVWTHLASTFDGAVLRLYVDGNLATSMPVSGSLAASSGPLRIGGNSVWAEWFAGVIDEVRVYARALSAAQIQADMQSPVG